MFTQRSKFYANLSYSNVGEAAVAINAMNQFHVGGEFLSCS